jgi:uncharacterized protein YggU (UPF0235/DUF167 family)
VLRVQVKPRASRDAIAGERDGALVLRLTAPPAGGAANAALSRFIAQALGVPPSRVTLLAGATARHKKVAVAGISEKEARRLLEAIPSAGKDRG